MYRLWLDHEQTNLIYKILKIFGFLELEFKKSYDLPLDLLQYRRENSAESAIKCENPKSQIAAG